MVSRRSACVAPRDAAKHIQSCAGLDAKRHDLWALCRPAPALTARRDPRMSHSCLNFLKLGTGSGERSIAVRRDEGAAPGVFWMGGFKSDMKGTKAEALAQWARENGRSCLRFDYSGHGESSGDFTAGTIGAWLEDSLAVFEAEAKGPQVVVGSSMGGWLALLLVRELRRR